MKEEERAGGHIRERPIWTTARTLDFTPSEMINSKFEHKSVRIMMYILNSTPTATWRACKGSRKTSLAATAVIWEEMTVAWTRMGVEGWQQRCSGLVLLKF